MSEKIISTFKNYSTVRIVAPLALTSYFRSIFQAGFFFHCQVGLNIGDLLFHQLALDEELVEKKISTIFLDGQCVDDITSAILKDGSVVALSSALPGLAGATLRRGGFYASLRNSITYHKDNQLVRPEKGIITVKLFNLLMKELGSVFLRKGILVSRSMIISFFQTQKEHFWREIKTVYFNDKNIAFRELSEEKTYDSTDYVRICIDEENKS